DLEAQCFAQGRACDPSQEGIVARETGTVAQNGIQCDIVNGVFTPTAITLITAPSANFAKIETDGIDLEISYRLDTGVGRFDFAAAASHVLSYKDQSSPFGSPVEEAG